MTSFKHLSVYLSSRLKVRFYSYLFYQLVFRTFQLLGAFFSLFFRRSFPRSMYVVDLLPTSYGHIVAELHLACLKYYKSGSTLTILNWPTYLTSSFQTILDSSQISFTTSFAQFIFRSFRVGFCTIDLRSVGISDTYHHSHTSIHALEVPLVPSTSYDSYFFRDSLFTQLLDSPSSPPLTEFLNTPRLFNPPYAVLQYKSEIVNGTSTLLSHTSLIPTIHLLHQLGLRVIHCGREPTSTLLSDHGVIDSSHICDHSLANDLSLVNHSEIVISSASGFAFLASSLNKKLLFCNYWHHRIPQPGANTLLLPTLFYRNSYLLTLSECLSYRQEPSSLHTDSGLTFIPPSSCLIYSSVQQLLGLTVPSFSQNALVADWQSLFYRLTGYSVNSRPSYSYLEFFANQT